MNTSLVLAAVGLALVGAAHSVLGEILVFRSLRLRGVVPTGGQPVLREQHVRILWGSWHLVTVLGWALSALLWRLGTVPVDAGLGAWAPGWRMWRLAPRWPAGCWCFLPPRGGTPPGWR